MGSAPIIIIICSLIIISYIFDILSRKTHIPSVLLLILLGIGLRVISEYYHVATIDFLHIIPSLGTIGLILIVLEGGLELEYHKEKNKIIINALILSVTILVATAFGVAGLFYSFTGKSYYSCLVNAIPFSVISSAIAIPSAAALTKDKKEFITFESTLSDIFGIVFFNYGIAYSYISLGVIGAISLELLIVTVVSLIFCLALIFLLKSIEHHVKFILIISAIILLYAIGKEVHLSSLILVLIFGLLIKNIQLFKSDFIQKHFNNVKFRDDFELLYRITAEGVFFIKTFFFVIFGYIMELSQLFNLNNLIIAAGIIIIIYSIRLILMLIIRRAVLPELFYSPRGLISILLFFSLPLNMKIPIINEGLLFIIVLSTSLIMLGSLFVKGKLKTLHKVENASQPE